MNLFVKNIVTIAVLQFLLLFCATSTKAQTDATSDSLFYPVKFVEFSVDHVVPINTYKESLDENLWGFSFAYLRQRESENVDYFGFQFDYAHLGQLTGATFDQDIETGTNNFSLQLLYRNYPDFYFWKVEPFFEVSLGPQAFYTVTTTTFVQEQTNDLQFNEFDMGLSYGLDLGFSLHIYGDVFFLYKMGYHGGTSITYFVEDPDRPFSFPIDAFVPRTSSTNNLRFNFGISVSI